MNTPRPYSRHGLNALKRRVKVRGLEAIDKRTATAKAVLAWRKALVTDLGGEESLSAQQRTVIELAVRTQLYVFHLDAWLSEQRSLVDHKRKAILPVLRERTQLADALSRYLQALGLERKAKDVPDLRSLLADAANDGDGKAKAASSDPHPALPVPAPQDPDPKEQA